MATAVLDTYNHNVNHPHIALKKPLLQEPLEQYGVITPKQLIGQALHQRVEAIDHEMCEPGDEDTFFVADLGEVYRQHLRWKKNLPRVRPFYGEYKSRQYAVIHANKHQPSSATPILRLSSFYLSLEPASIVPPRPRLSRSCPQGLAPTASSMPNPARLTRMSDTSSLWASNR